MKKQWKKLIGGIMIAALFCILSIPIVAFAATDTMMGNPQWNITNLGYGEINGKTGVVWVEDYMPASDNWSNYFLQAQLLKDEVVLYDQLLVGGNGYMDNDGKEYLGFDMRQYINDSGNYKLILTRRAYDLTALQNGKQPQAMADPVISPVFQYQKPAKQHAKVTDLRWNVENSKATIYWKMPEAIDNCRMVFALDEYKNGAWVEMSGNKTYFTKSSASQNNGDYYYQISLQSSTIKENVSYRFKLRVISNDVTTTANSDWAYSTSKILNGSTTQLGTPTGLTWNVDATGKRAMGTLCWNAVNNCNVYQIKLYNDTTGSIYIRNQRNMDAVNGKYALDLAEQFVDAGDYYFTVQAIGNGSTYTDSNVSAKSTTWKYAKPSLKLGTVTDLNWIDGKPAWKATANPTTLPVKYEVVYYKLINGTYTEYGLDFFPEQVLTTKNGYLVSDNYWLTELVKMNGSGQWAFTVRATSTDISVVQNGQKSNYSAAKALKTETLTGDVNDDGLVDTRDRIAVSRYIANIEKTIDMEAADINKDGKVTAWDRAALARHLANWKNYEDLDVHLLPDFSV